MLNGPLRFAMEVTLLVIIGFLSIFDLIVEIIDSRTHQIGATISEIFIFTAYAHPMLPLLLGMLLGHLTFPTAQTRPGIVTALLVVSFLIMGFAADRFGAIPPMMPVMPLVVGLVCGHFLWPQKVTTETGQTLVVQKAGTVTIGSRNLTQTITVRKP